MFTILFCAASHALAIVENWPGWRGPRGDGTSLATNIPIQWSSEALLWKTPLPGIGHASPIVWDDRIFTVSALPESEMRVLLCIDRTSGKLAWQKTVLQSPLERKHSLNSHASSTPATDGQRVYVAFLDVREMAVAAYALDGRQEWLVRPGPFTSMHGFCSSPILFKDLVIVNGDHDGDSYIVALNKKTGATVWKTPRENKTRSYCVPLIRELAGRTQMVLSGDAMVASYDPNSGRRHWMIRGPTEQFVASLVYSPAADMLFVTGGYPEHHILAIRPDGLGDITDTHIVWRATKGAAYVPSPITEGQYFLVVSDQGFATCFHAKTGKLLWQERLGEHHASLVSAAGLVYFVNDEGAVNVVRPGPEFDRVGQANLGERVFASPALSQGCVVVRGDQHLFCIGAAPN